MKEVQMSDSVYKVVTLIGTRPESWEKAAKAVVGALLASMSHEIRTPMNTIMGIADLLAKTALSPEQDKYVQIVRRAGDNLLNLINDILDLSKVEASQLDYPRFTAICFRRPQR
jgi:signal transduction histidine kinase